MWFGFNRLMREGGSSGNLNMEEIIFLTEEKIAGVFHKGGVGQ